MNPTTPAASPASKFTSPEVSNKNFYATWRDNTVNQISKKICAMHHAACQNRLSKIQEIVGFDPRPVMEFIKLQPGLSKEEKENYHNNLFAFIAAKRPAHSAKLTNKDIADYSNAFEKEIRADIKTKIVDEINKLIDSIKGDESKIVEMTMLKNKLLEVNANSIHDFYLQSPEDKKIQGQTSYEHLANALGGFPDFYSPKGAAELNKHIESSLQDTETPLNPGESSTQGKLVDDTTPSLQLASSVAAAQQGLDTQFQTVVLLLIYGTIPGLDIVAAVWYLQKYGIYNNSLSLVDNLIINSHLNPKVVLLDSYISKMNESRRALLEIKEKMAETHNSLHDRKNGPEKYDQFITRVLDPTVEFESTTNAPDLATRHKVSKAFYEKLQDSLATIHGTLNSNNTRQAIINILDDSTFSTYCQDLLFPDPTQVNKDKVINQLVKIILGTRQCIHYTEAEDNTGGQNTSTNAFRVLNNKINNAKKNLISLARDVPFRDYGVSSFQKVKGQKEYKRTFLEILEGLYENPGDHKIWGPTAQTDVFGKKVRYQHEGHSRPEWAPRDLMQHPDVLRALIKPLLELFGSELVTAKHESDSQDNIQIELASAPEPENVEIEVTADEQDSTLVQLNPETHFV